MNNVKNDLFEFNIGEDGIGILTMDQVNNPTNLFSGAFLEAYLTTAQQAVDADNVKGVIVTSGRSMFMPGADLRELNTMGGEPKELFEGAMSIHRRFRAIETGGKPFVAAINGTAMGGGMELCCSCHHRIVLNNSKIQLGFPENFCSSTTSLGRWLSQ